MKLWQKASVLSGAVLLTVVAICSGMLLLYAQRSILDLAETQTAERQSALVSSFREMTDYYLLGAEPASVRDSLVRWLCQEKCVSF